MKRKEETWQEKKRQTRKRTTQQNRTRTIGHKVGRTNDYKPDNLSQDRGYPAECKERRE